MDAYVNEANGKMEKSIESFKGALGKLRSGRANPAILEGIQCDYYGDKMDINSLCSISMSAGGAKISDSATSTSLAVYFNRIDYQKGTEVYSLVDAGKDSGREVSDYYLQLGAINYPSLSTRSNSGTILDSDVTIYDASKVAVPDKNDKTIAGTFVAVYTPTVLTSEHTLSSNLHLYWASSVDPASVSSLYAQAGITHFPDLANEYKITVGEGYTFQLDLALEAPAVKASNTAASKITISPSFSVASSAIVDPGLNLQVNKSWNSWSGAWEEWAYYVPACNAAIFNGLVGLFNPANWSQLSGIVGMNDKKVLSLFNTPLALDMEQGRQKRAEVLRAFHAWSRAASNGFGFLPF